MNTRPLLWVLAILLPCGITARELRTPWSLQRGAIHHPLPRPVECDSCWFVDVWGGALHRDTNAAFRDKETVKTDPSLAEVIFGEDEFVVLDAFAPGTIVPCNPFLATSVIRPRIRYRENAAYFGFNYERVYGCDCRWRLGVRTIIPFRSLTTELENCCDLEEETDFSSVCRLQDENVEGVAGQDPTPQRVPDCYAYRLDFLSSLFIEQSGPTPQPLVVFNGAGGLVRINGQDVTNANNNGPINLVVREDETPPQGNFCAPRGMRPTLPADGEGLANDSRVVFDSATNYTPLANNLAAQRELWVVPTVALASGTTNVVMDTTARNIGDAITNITRKINTSAIDFLAENGVSFNTNHWVGIGDIDTELYLDYEYCQGIIEGIFGVKFPTGIRVKNPGKLLSIFSTGNNRHFEVKVGAVATWEPNCWFYLEGDFFYSHVFSRTERVAAPFEGATVKNIGPAIDGKIKWNYLQGHLQTTYLVPTCPCIGFTVGYEWYMKFKDHVSFNQTTATDFTGQVRPLNPALLEERTNIVAHKIRTEMFKMGGDAWQIFGGFAHVFAGKNATKDSDWHLGFTAYF